MNYFGLCRESKDDFFVKVLGCNSLAKDYQLMDYIRERMPYFFDIRVKKSLRVRKNVSVCYDYNKLEKVMESWLLKILKKEKNNSPLVSYCKQLYRQRAPRLEGKILNIMDEWANSQKTKEAV